MKTYKIRKTRLSIMPEGEPIYSEQCTHATIEDDVAGEYIAIEQQSNSVEAKEQRILIDPDEWPALKEAVQLLIQEIESHTIK